VVGLKKVIEEMAGKIASLDQRIADLSVEKENLMRKLLKWEPLELQNLTPEKIQVVVQEKANTKDTLCEGTGSLEEDICKLKSLLIVKLKEYKAFGALEKVNESVNKRLRSNSCEEHKESKSEVDKQRKKSEDRDYNLNLGEIEELLRIVECPFKTQVKTIQELLDENKVRIAGLEKKERILEKIMNTSVFIPYKSSSNVLAVPILSYLLKE